MKPSSKQENSVSKGEEQRWNKERGEVRRASVPLRSLSLRCFVIQVAFARPNPAVNNDPAGDEQCAIERLQLVEHQNSTR